MSTHGGALLSAFVREALGQGMTLPEVMCQVRRAAILEALEKAKGNVTLAATGLGIHRNTLTRDRKEWDLG